MGVQAFPSSWRAYFVGEGCDGVADTLIVEEIGIIRKEPRPHQPGQQDKRPKNQKERNRHQREQSDLGV